MPAKPRTTTPSRPLAEQVLERQANPETDDGCWIKDCPPRVFLPTGSTMVNLAMSDKVNGGWPTGRVCVMTGDTDTGKSTFGMSCLAEACMLKAFENHELIYIDAEQAVDFNYQRVFGRKFVERVKVYSAAQEEEDLQPPETIQELHYMIMDLIEKKVPFVILLDSLDFLPSKEELEKSAEEKTAWKKGQDTAGTYQMSKQKYAKRMLREVMNGIRGTDSLLILIRQTIDNIGGMGGPKTAAGGNAIEFANRMEPWLSNAEQISKNDKIIGKKIKVKIRKNHITGKKRDVFIWLYDGYGIQDAKGCLDFLVKEKKIQTKSGGWIIWEGENIQTKNFLKLASSNKDGVFTKLREMVQQTWDEIENDLKPDWAPRYE